MNQTAHNRDHQDMVRHFIHLLNNHGWIFENIPDEDALEDIDPRYERADIVLGCTYQPEKKHLSVIITTSRFDKVVEFGFDCDDKTMLEKTMKIIIGAQDSINFHNYSDTIKSILQCGAIIFWEIQGYTHDRVILEELPTTKFERRL